MYVNVLLMYLFHWFTHAFIYLNMFTYTYMLKQTNTYIHTYKRIFIKIYTPVRTASVIIYDYINICKWLTMYIFHLFTHAEKSICVYAYINAHANKHRYQYIIIHQHLYIPARTTSDLLSLFECVYIYIFIHKNKQIHSYIHELYVIFYIPARTASGRPSLSGCCKYGLSCTRFNSSLNPSRRKASISCASCCSLP
jgi:hypothetical protein